MTRLTLALMAVLSTSACAAHPDGFTIYRASNDEAVAVLEAAATWCELTGRCLTFHGGDSTIAVVDEVQERPGTAGNVTGRIHYRANDASDITVERVDLQTIYEASLHEFGHHMGCRDVPPEVDDCAVMRHWGERGEDCGAFEPTSADLDCVHY